MNPEQQKEWEERRASFLAKYKELIDEYQCDFMSIPMYVPNENGTWETVLRNELVDKKNMAVKSPFIAQ